MSAVPHAKAGVGSAVNDTTREVGGALGIAVLGSISSATYRSAVDLDGLLVPPAVVAAARESVGAATVIAQGLPDGAELAARAGRAFTDAFNLASTVAVALAVALALVAAAVVAVVFSPRAEQLAAEGTAVDPGVRGAG
jgi:DHA2 family multidrug resistance protein-like MFS transporter